MTKWLWIVLVFTPLAQATSCDQALASAEEALAIARYQPVVNAELTYNGAPDAELENLVATRFAETKTPLAPVTDRVVIDVIMPKRSRLGRPRVDIELKYRNQDHQLLSFKSRVQDKRALARLIVLCLNHRQMLIDSVFFREELEAFKQHLLKRPAAETETKTWISGLEEVIASVDAKARGSKRSKLGAGLLRYVEIKREFLDVALPRAREEAQRRIPAPWGDHPPVFTGPYGVKNKSGAESAPRELTFAWLTNRDVLETHPLFKRKNDSLPAAVWILFGDSP